MTRSAPPTPHSRDDALRRLRGLTIGVAGAALGAVAVFATISATTIPGPTRDNATQSDTSGTAAASDSSGASDSNSSSSLQPSSSQPQFTSRGSGHAVTGGS